MMKSTLPFSIVILFLFAAKILFAQNYWHQIEKPTQNNLDAVQFLDSTTGWVAGDSGLILHTTNGGTTWFRQNSKLNTQIHDLVFLNKNLGWGLSLKYIAQPYGTYVLKTTNGGQNWDTTLFSGDNAFFNKIYWLDSLEGFLGGFAGTLLKTTNGGLSWYQAYIDSGIVSRLPILNFAFYNHNYGFACGGFVDFSGVIWKTTDNGETWNSVSVSADPVHDLHFFDSTRVIGVGGDFEYGTGYVRTTDAGGHWNFISLQTYGIGLTAAFRTTGEAWVPLGIGNDIIFTSDSGKTWTSYKHLDHSNQVFNYSIQDINFANSTTGFAVGSDGVILKYSNFSNGDIPDLINGNNSTPSKFHLSQNYPNPFNPSTKIEYSVPSASYVEIKVYDTLGKQVSSLVNEYKQPGAYEVTFNNRNLPSGIYFYEFKAKNFISVKKMIILK